jgi:hypothetical protein
MSTSTQTPNEPAAVPSHPLDNVVWHALNTRQIQFSAGDDRARRLSFCVLCFADRNYAPSAGSSGKSSGGPNGWSGL